MRVADARWRRSPVATRHSSVAAHRPPPHRVASEFARSRRRRLTSVDATAYDEQLPLHQSNLSGVRALLCSLPSQLPHSHLPMPMPMPMSRVAQF